MQFPSLIGRVGNQLESANYSSQIQLINQIIGQSTRYSKILNNSWPSIRPVHIPKAVHGIFMVPGGEITRSTGGSQRIFMGWTIEPFKLSGIVQWTQYLSPTSEFQVFGDSLQLFASASHTSVRKRRRNCSVGKNLQSILNLTILGKGENPFSSFFVLASVYIQVYLFPVPNWNRKEVDETKSKYRITRQSVESMWQSATIYHQEIAEGREDVVSKANIKHETCGNVIMMTMRWSH